MSDEVQLNSDTPFFRCIVRNQNTTKSGPSSAQQRNAGGAIIIPILNAGLVAFDFPGDLDQHCLRAPKISDFAGRGSGPSVTPSLDPRILILVEIADITKKIVDWDVKNKIKQNKNHNNEPCIVCICFIAVLFAPLRQ